MQNIHVNRYQQPAAGFDGTIEPEDRSWILWVAVDGTPSLWVAKETTDDDGVTRRVYVPRGAVLCEPSDPSSRGGASCPRPQR